MRRYIDADKLPRHGKRGGIVYWRDIENQSTEDVRKNVKGTWERVYFGPIAWFWTCSACGFPSGDLDAKEAYNFCPNCGAEME